MEKFLKGKSQQNSLNKVGSYLDNEFNLIFNELVKNKNYDGTCEFIKEKYPQLDNTKVYLLNKFLSIEADSKLIIELAYFAHLEHTSSYMNLGILDPVEPITPARIARIYEFPEHLLNVIYEQVLEIEDSEYEKEQIIIVDSIIAPHLKKNINYVFEDLIKNQKTNISEYKMLQEYPFLNTTDVPIIKNYLNIWNGEEKYVMAYKIANLKDYLKIKISKNKEIEDPKIKRLLELDTIDEFEIANYFKIPNLLACEIYKLIENINATNM